MHRYDAAGNEIRWTDSAGREMAFEYDGHHNCTAERRTDGLQVREHRSVYDWMGRLALSREADGQEIRYAYGAHGREEETGTARSIAMTAVEGSRVL